MSGRIFNLHVPVHQASQELLPWLAAGTLEGKDLAMVQEHLQTCSQCRADLDWQRQLLSVQSKRPPTLDVDVAFRKLESRLDETRQEQAAGAVHPRRPYRDPTWMRWAMAAQFIAIVSLSAVVLQRNAPGDYRMLGAASHGDANVVVMFKPDASEKALREALKGSNARLIGGPTVTDAYLLNVPEPDVAAAVAKLRGNGVVTLAEPLHAEGRTR